MAKAKQRSSSAAQRREEVKKQRQQRMAPAPSTSSRSRKNERRRRQSNQLPWGLLVGAVFVIVAFIGAFIYISHQSASSGSATPTPASSSVLNAVTHVSPTVLAAVGTGGQDKV